MFAHRTARPRRFRWFVRRRGPTAPSPPAVALPRPNERSRRILGAAAVAFFVLAVVRRGWIADDAFITSRTVDNLLHGRGFVYNGGERVLGITHPLWAWLVTPVYALLGDPYWSLMWPALAVSAVFGALLVFRVAPDRRAGAWMLVSLSFSRSFVDFSTSGLENPLTHLLLLLYFGTLLAGQSPSLGRSSLLASLCLLNRLDLLPLVTPPLLYAWWKSPERSAGWRLLRGSLPLVGWLAFCLFYYGSPWPNTAFAKLNADIPSHLRWAQGTAYLLDCLRHDPMLVLLAALAAILTLTQPHPRPLVRVALLAMLLQTLAVVSMGGDFMSGRFWTPVLATAAVLIVHTAPRLASDTAARRWILGGTVALILSLGFSPFREDPVRETREMPPTLIVDERSWYQEYVGVLNNLRHPGWQDYGLYQEGRAVREQGHRLVVYKNLGMYGFGAGTRCHVVDEMALTDPLLARMPYVYQADWRPGHLPRPIPDGYLDTLHTGRNVIKDRCLHRYYEQLRQLTRGPLLGRERWRAIVSLNLPGGLTARACP